MPRRINVAVVLLFIASSAVAQPANQVPSVEQLSAQLDTSPQAVLQGVARLLAMKGPAAAQLDRYELFMLRGEAHLRNKAMPAAADAFAAAGKETTDPAKKSTARATEVLVRKSKATGYVPKPPKPGAAPATRPVAPIIPIIKPDDRKQAMEALLNDEMAVAQPKLRAADNAQALPPIIEGVRVLFDLNALEKASTGQDAQTKGLSANMGKRAHMMISSALDNMSKRTEEIWRSASTPNRTINAVTNTYDTNPSMAGLMSNDTKFLKQTIVDCEKIAPVAAELGTVTGGPELAGDAAAAEKLYLRAKEVLEYDYPNAGRYSRTPQQQPLIPQQRQPLPPQPQQPQQPQPQPQQPRR